MINQGVESSDESRFNALRIRYLSRKAGYFNILADTKLETIGASSILN